MAVDAINPIRELIANLLMNDGLVQVADVKPLQLVNGQWVPSTMSPYGRRGPFDNPPPRPQPRTGTDADFQK